MDPTGFACIAAAVEQALPTGKVGIPVAARVIVHALDDPERIPPLLARIVESVSRWMQSEAHVLWVSGDLRKGQWTALIRFVGGQSLLVTSGVAPAGMPLMEVTVYGNHGILACEAGTVAGMEPKESSSPSETDRRFLSAVRQAIQTRQAVDVRTATPVAAGDPPVSGSMVKFDLFAKSPPRPLPPPYGVLLVAGDHTHQPGYAEAFQADARCRIIGVVDDRPGPDRHQWNEHYAKRMGFRLFADFGDAVNRPDVHIVSICAEPERRAPLIVAAATAGKHLYLDKPLCASVAEAAEIVSAVRQNRVLAQMFSQVFWDPATRVRQVLASGELGELQAIHCDLCFAKGHTGGAQLGAPRSEVTAPQNFELPDAKRELTNIGVYPLVMMLSLLRRNVKRVFASTGNYFFPEHQTRDMEDFGQILLELDGGITASVTAGRTGWNSHPSGGLHRITLVGTNRIAVIDAHRPRVEVWSDSPPWKAPGRDPEDPLAMWASGPESPFRAEPKTNWHTPAVNRWRTDVERFLNHLEQGEDAEITAEIAAAATATLLAAYRSAATWRVVE